MREFSVGDKVKLKSNIKIMDFPWITEWMGKELTISRIINEHTARVEENEWLYDLSRFELIYKFHDIEPVLFTSKDVEL
jgi:hypothetical protein